MFPRFLLDSFDFFRLALAGGYRAHFEQSGQLGEDASAHAVGGDGQRWFWLRSIPHKTDTAVTNRELFQ